MSKNIPLKSKLSGPECSQQPSKQRAEQQGVGEKERVTSRKADKLRITAPYAIIVMKAIELHLERSHLLGCHAGPGGVYLHRKADGRTYPLHTHTPVCIRTGSFQGRCHLSYPRTPEGISLSATAHAALLYGAVRPHTALLSIGGGLNRQLSLKSRWFSTF